MPADDQGRMVPDQLPDIDGPVLLCAQAGEVNTGAFDPFEPLADWVAERNGWLHVDAAFGMWALADPSRRHLVAGLDRADSIAADGRLPAARQRVRGDAPHSAVVPARSSVRSMGGAAHART